MFQYIKLRFQKWMEDGRQRDRLLGAMYDELGVGLRSDVSIRCAMSEIVLRRNWGATLMRGARLGSVYLKKEDGKFVYVARQGYCGRLVTLPVEEIESLVSKVKEWCR